jgi:hypothetical protein
MKAKVVIVQEPEAELMNIQFLGIILSVLSS